MSVPGVSASSVRGCPASAARLRASAVLPARANSHTTEQSRILQRSPSHTQCQYPSATHISLSYVHCKHRREASDICLLHSPVATFPFPSITACRLLSWWHALDVASSLIWTLTSCSRAVNFITKHLAPHLRPAGPPGWPSSRAACTRPGSPARPPAGAAASGPPLPPLLRPRLQNKPGAAPSATVVLYTVYATSSTSHAKTPCYMGEAYMSWPSI